MLDFTREVHGRRPWPARPAARPGEPAVEAPSSPDQEARDRALDPEGSFLVQAPAGSGKTGLLTQRYLTLLATVGEPEEILAITFTRKAAGEMRARILRSLEQAREAPPADPFARRTWRLARRVLERDEQRDWCLQANPARLRVQTIDSLCHHLARQMPVLSRFGAPLETVDDASDLYLRAARAALGHLESGSRRSQAVERLLRHLDNNVGYLERLLGEMLSRRDQWLRHVAHPGRRDLRPVLEQGLRRALGEGLQGLRHAFPAQAVGDLCSLAAWAGAHSEDLAPLRALADLPGTDPEDVPAWRALARLLLTGSGAWRRKVDRNCGFPAPGQGPGAEERRLRKEEMAALLDDLRPREGLRERLHDVAALPPPAYEDRQWEVLEALFEVLLLAAGELALLFRETGKCDFTEFALKAAEALGPEDRPTDLALALDFRIRHLLVDEFQDTSLSQFRLLERLTAGWEPGDGRTLFLVGDPMQSIYRFRDAEVGLFLRARTEGLGTVPLEPLELTANFRSQGGLVDWFNGCFGQVFPAVQDRNTGAVPYSDAVAARPEAGGPAVCVHPAFTDDPRAEAERVLEVVRAEREEDPEASVAVLVRSREHLREIMPRLRSAGLSFQAVELERLDTRPVVQDLMALVRALAHPGDRIAWLALLRAPWCGLTMREMALLAEARDRSVWDLLNDHDLLDRLGEEPAGRCRRLRDLLAEALEARGRRPLRRVVEGAWLSLGGPACLRQEAEVDDAMAFLDLLDGLDPDGGLPDLERLEQKVHRLFARPDPTADPRLQVMTVHRAKGLEFDVVLLPGLARRAGRPHTPLMLRAERLNAEGSDDLLLGPITESGQEKDPVYRYLAAVEGKREAHEGARLLYVAATRAVKRLHLFGHAVRNEENGEVVEPRGSMLGLLWPVVGAEFLAASGALGPAALEAAAGPAVGEAPSLAAPGDSAGQVQSGPGAGPPPGATALEAPDPDDPFAAPLPPLRRLPAGWVAPEPPAAAALARASREEAEEPPDFRWAGETVRHVGTLVHRVLHQVGRQGLERWPAERVERMGPAFRAALSRLGVPGHDLDEAEERTRQALLHVLGTERGRWILDGRHQDARCEYSLCGVLKGRVVRGKMDRTFVDGQGVRWVIDYKTGTHEGSDVEAFLDAEQARYRPQLDRYAALLALLDPRPVRLGLYFPMLAGWREWSARPAPLAVPR